MYFTVDYGKNADEKDSNKKAALNNPNLFYYIFLLDF